MIEAIDVPVVGLTEQLELPLEPSEAELDNLIPTPVGYHILIKMPEIEETFGDSGIIKSAKTMHHDSILSMVGLVLDMGAEAYADERKFPSGPWCKVGDYVMFRANSGTRFLVAGKEFRIMNDDSIEAVVRDPSAISRVN